MSDDKQISVDSDNKVAVNAAQKPTQTPTSHLPQPVPVNSSFNNTTPASSVTGVPVSRLKAPSNFGGSTGAVSKIGRPCSHATPKAGPPSRDTNSMSRESDDNLSSINSQYTDHGSILTHDTEQFIIGQKVWVGGIRPGQIAYIGETHFAPGEWAGVVLDEPNGKNDGCVAGKRYFQCEPKRGIFSRLTRLTMAPLPGAQTPTSPLSKFSPERSRTVSPTASIRSSFMRSPGKNGLTVGDRVIVSSGFGSRPGILRYLGETQFASGNWCGIELDEASGKNDGSVDGIRYFECKAKYGVFVPIAKVSISPSSKKSRLSRTGSRESLTSIGTMNSIATTNTSRMRMSAQRKSSTFKPVAAATTPKSQFSMQDLLREKQQHIEQLMIERDLDREDTQNQGLQYQKNINELKTRVTLLERQLNEERKKGEDLQFSVDEATFCGDELNAQTQVYREKILELETKIKDISKGKITADDANSSSSAEIADLNSLLKEETQKFEVQINDLQDEQQRLLENIKYLQLQNETLQKELVEKDQSLEKFSLSECGIENLRKEMALLKEESDKEKDQLQTDYKTKLEEKVQEMKVLKDEISTLKGSIGTVEGENANLQDECNILKTECKNRDLQIESLNSEVAKKEAELSMRQAECSTLDELLKDQQQGNAKEKTFLEQKCQEIAKLKEEVKELTKTNHTLETNVQRTNEELKKLANIETDLKNAIKQDEEKTAAIQDAEVAMQELRNEYNKSQSENEELHANIKKFQQDWIAKERTLIDHHNIELKEKETTIHEFKEQLKLTKESSEVFEKQLAETKKENDAVITTKTEEIISLKNEIHKMLEKTTALEGESTSAVQQMSAKISHLESQNKRLEDDLKNSNAMIEDQRLKSVQQDEHIANKLSELKSTMSSLENTSKLLEKLKQEHDSSINRRQELEDELRKSVEKNNQQQLELGDITRKLETTSQKCDNLVAQNETLQMEVITARSSSSDIQNELQKLNDSVQNKEREIQNLINVADEDRIKTKGQMEELEQKLANAFKDYAELREVIQNAKEELARKQQQITEMEEKTIKQELLLSDNQRQQDILQTKYESLQKQNETLLNDLTSLRTSSTDSNAELLKLTQEIASRQGAYEELVDKANTEKSSLESQLQAKQQRIDAMCSQVETLTSELKTLTEENFKRFELLKQEQDKCGKQELEMADIQRKLDSFVRKCEKLEEQNQCLQTDLNAFRTGSADSKSEISKLTEECAHKKKELQDLSDKSSNERLAFETRIQELKQNIQTQQAEMEGLRSTVQSLEAGNLEQSSEFDAARKELEAKAEMELKELKDLEKTKKQKLVESFEAQLKNAEQTKSCLDEAITSLQQQIQLLQDELLKSQLDFKAKENEMQKQLEFANLERDKLQKTLKQSQTEGSSSLNSLQEENARLLQSIQHLTGQLQEKEDALVGLQSEIQQLRILQSNSKSELETQLQKLHNSLELRQSEYEHKSKLHEEDQHKIEELKVLIENLKTSNSNMTATNGQLAEALEVLEQEKYETANIFELFEMESDQNMESLVEKLSSLKQELASAQENVLAKDIELSEKEQNLQTLQATLAETQASLDEKQSIALDKATQLAELRQANEELQKVQMETQEELQKQHELEVQLEEYKKIIDEMDATSTEKSTQLQQLQSQIKQLQLEKNTFLERECSLTEEYKLLQRKLELKDIEKQKEIVQLKQRINDLQSVNKLRQNGTGDTESGQPSGDASDESTAQINFLNSIIADMQKKNDTLKAKIEALEALPTDFTKPHAFDLITKRKPAPRLFCDICDVFDSHETEDCPLQASDDRDYSPPRSAEKNNNDPANKKDRKLPEPRKYCESCEVFGHEAGECDDECY